MFRNYLYTVFEKSTRGRLAIFGLVIPASQGLSWEQTPFSMVIPLSLLISFAVLLLIILLLLGRYFGPRISVGFLQRYHDDAISLQNDGIIDASETITRDRDGEEIVEVELNFDVPSYQDDVYISFEVHDYGVGVSNEEPVNFDHDKAITYHSSIPSFDLELQLVPLYENGGNDQTLEIKNKLNGRTIRRLNISA